MLLAWKYVKVNELCTEKFKKKFEDIKQDEREQDKFWLFIYEFAEKESDLPEQQSFLKRTQKTNQKSFVEVLE